MNREEAFRKIIQTTVEEQLKAITILFSTSLAHVEGVIKGYEELARSLNEEKLGELEKKINSLEENLTRATETLRKVEQELRNLSRRVEYKTKKQSCHNPMENPQQNEKEQKKRTGKERERQEEERKEDHLAVLEEIDTERLKQAVDSLSRAVDSLDQVMEKALRSTEEIKGLGRSVLEKVRNLPPVPRLSMGR